jgi:16S rRNA processing protein RimM
VDSSPNPRFVTVARIVRARGNKGEVVAELLTDFPERLKSLSQLFLAAENAAANGGEPRAVTLKSFWIDRNHPGFGIFHFDGVASISEAEKLRGLEIQILFEQRVSLPAGLYFVSDLIGCSVFELPQRAAPLASPPCSAAEAPAHLGSVAGVFFPGESQPGVPLLSVQTSAGELLIPLAEDFCKSIDVAARRIDVFLPEGFHELNGRQ